MKINSELGYEPVTYSELTTDEEFWKGCQSCVNYDILVSKGRKNCMCTAMLFDPEEAEEKLRQARERELQKTTVVTPQGELVTHRHREFKGKFSLFERWVRFKQFVLLKSFRKKDDGGSEGNGERKKSLFSIFFW
jgi:hypothetical protein